MNMEGVKHEWSFKLAELFHPRLEVLDEGFLLLRLVVQHHWQLGDAVGANVELL